MIDVFSDVIMFISVLIISFFYYLYSPFFIPFASASPEIVQHNRPYSLPAARSNRNRSLSQLLPVPSLARIVLVE
jgi:hypothetical protein